MSNTFTLLTHQNKFIHDLRQALREHKSVLGQAPTGMGKTVCASFMTATAHNKGHDVIFMVHRRELIEQTSKTFARAGIPHTFIAAGNHHNPHMKVAIASVGTMVNRLDSLRPPKLLIVDEAHHCAAAGWAKCVNWAKAYRSMIIGLTATPWRLSGEGLRDYFEHMVLGPETGWLIKNGFLSQYNAFAPSAPDLSGVHSQAGDYVQAELEAIMMGKAIITGFVDQYKSKAYGKRTVGFAASIKHSKRIVEEFIAAGIPAAHVDAETPYEERKQHILNFAAGHIPVLWNVGLFGEGFDLSAIAGHDVPIEAVIQGRPTQSLSLHLQQLGRGLRKKDEPAILLDHAGNIRRHGLPDSPFVWSLDPREKRKGKKKEEDEQTDAVRQCPVCFFVHTPAPICAHCGHVYEVIGRGLEEVDGNLHQIKIEDLEEIKKKPQSDMKTLDDLIKMGYARGYKPGNAERWAAHVFTARQRKVAQGGR